ncbi:RsfA family transcriptional regulator [Robertmurraya korlensis]|uniref:RsfA family transcriptional regulator n=1 Tax=Robertmurraya korlensis TaxID=519977 RepID=UPI00203F6486|nr:RsfA family transcriptional regulator [Robertmurraya korlensis]MCM3600298.1 RsfA family transcriptional regulator [Robertmurraya korlensis]
MPTNRQDAWSQDEDLLLAEVVLRNIREGGTQLQAFEEVGKQLSRTAAACGFRWNSYVRKQYKSGIEIAKKQRKELKKNAIAPSELEEFEESSLIEQPLVESPQTRSYQIEFNDLVAFLKELYDKADSSQKEEHDNYKKHIQELEKQLYYLAAENEKLEKELKLIEQDYKALIDIMERARKMVVLHEEDRQKK